MELDGEDNDGLSQQARTALAVPVQVVMHQPRQTTLTFPGLCKHRVSTQSGKIPTHLRDVDEVLVAESTAFGVCELERLDDAMIGSHSTVDVSQV